MFVRTRSSRLARKSMRGRKRPRLWSDALRVVVWRATSARAARRGAGASQTNFQVAACAVACAFERGRRAERRCGASSQAVWRAERAISRSIARSGQRLGLIGVAPALAFCCCVFFCFFWLCLPSGAATRASRGFDERNARWRVVSLYAFERDGA